jgi:hypothetical protein
MATDRAFSHPDFGREVRVEHRGREVHLIFVTHSVEQAGEFVETLVSQLRSGALNLTMMGEPTSVEEFTR